MSTYPATLEFLYSQLPVFESVGAHAYKPGLQRVEAMDAILGHPHRRFRTIHVAGTNGKGSVSHTLASILQCAGYRTGLFTSPHLLDFDERIRIDGTPISHDYVVEWVERYYEQLAHLQPSFFELATMIAFCYYADQGVDIAVIEVGLGGRLDSTNIISPILSVITNISPDHMQFLGDTLAQIAAEKAGIMKEGVPCVIGECYDDSVRSTFEQKAERSHVARLDFACDRPKVLWVDRSDAYHLAYDTIDEGHLLSPLMGDCQPKNANTIITALPYLRKAGLDIPAEAVERGFREVVNLTHLRGRWETLSRQPLVICDTGHNVGCFEYLGRQLQHLIDHDQRPLHIVFGMVSDKDIPAVLRLLPSSARYFFTNAPTPRALPATQLQQMAAPFGLQGEVYATIDQALDAAIVPEAITFVGGSNFVVCEAMKRF